MNRQPNQYTPIEDLMKLWDKKLDRLDDEMLTYIQQRCYLLLEYRLEKLNKETE